MSNENYIVVLGTASDLNIVLLKALNKKYEDDNSLIIDHLVKEMDLQNAFKLYKLVKEHLESVKFCLMPEIKPSDFIAKVENLRNKNKNLNYEDLPEDVKIYDYFIKK